MDVNMFSMIRHAGARDDRTVPVRGAAGRPGGVDRRGAGAPDRRGSTTLTPAEIAELDAALGRSVSRGLGPRRHRPFDVPVADAAPRRSTSWAEELDAGRGFVLVRGLPVHRYTEDEASIVYWGIGQHLGVPVSQNTDGDLLGHVRDTGADPGDPSVRLYRTRAAQPYHTDGSDVVGLLVPPRRRGAVARRASSAR